MQKQPPWGVLLKKGVPKNFAKFTGNYLCQGLFFNNAAGLTIQLYKIETLAQVFSCEYAEFLRTPF